VAGATRAILDSPARANANERLVVRTDNDLSARHTNHLRIPLHSTI